MNVTTITLDKSVKRQIDKLKSDPRQSYNDVLRKLLAPYTAGKSKGESKGEGMKETVAILSDPAIMESLAKSLQDLKQGKVYSLADV